MEVFGHKVEATTGECIRSLGGYHRKLVQDAQDTPAWIDRSAGSMWKNHLYFVRGAFEWYR
jgi:hypothetical protein